MRYLISAQSKHYGHSMHLRVYARDEQDARQIAERLGLMVIQIKRTPHDERWRSD